MILRAPLGNTPLQGLSRFVGFVGGGCSGLTFSDLLPVSEAGPGDAAALSDATSARAPPLLLVGCGSWAAARGLGGAASVQIHSGGVARGCRVTWAQVRVVPLCLWSEHLFCPPLCC